MHDTLENFRTALINERATGISLLAEATENSLPPTGALLRTMRLAIDQCELTIGEQAQWPVDPHRPRAAERVNPSLTVARSVANRSLAMVHCLRVLTEIAEHGLQTTDLKSFDLPEPTKTDPFTSKPLLLSDADDAVTVYSVGRNGQDDGGQVNGFNAQDVGFAMKRSP